MITLRSRVRVRDFCPCVCAHVRNNVTYLSKRGTEEYVEVKSINSRSDCRRCSNGHSQRATESEPPMVTVQLQQLKQKGGEEGERWNVGEWRLEVARNRGKRGEVRVRLSYKEHNVCFIHPITT